MSPRAPAALLATAGVLVMAGAPAAEGQVADLVSFDGRFSFVGGERERQRLRDAIDAVVGRLHFFARPIARAEIQRNIQPEQSISVVVVDEERVSLTLGEWGPLAVRLDGRARRVRGPDGGDTRLSARFRAGRLEVRQESPRGHRDDWLSLSPDAQYLFLGVRVGAPQLPEEIRYTLTYQRLR